MFEQEISGFRLGGKVLVPTPELAAEESEIRPGRS